MRHFRYRKEYQMSAERAQSLRRDLAEIKCNIASLEKQREPLKGKVRAVKTRQITPLEKEAASLERLLKDAPPAPRHPGKFAWEIAQRTLEQADSLANGWNKQWTEATELHEMLYLIEWRTDEMARDLASLKALNEFIAWVAYELKEVANDDYAGHAAALFRAWVGFQDRLLETVLREAGYPERSTNPYANAVENAKKAQNAKMAAEHGYTWTSEFKYKLSQEHNTGYFNEAFAAWEELNS